MKVRIETDKAAAMFSCAVGDYRGLEHRDALALIAAGDVSEVEETAAGAKPGPRKASKPKR